MENESTEHLFTRKENHGQYLTSETYREIIKTGGPGGRL